MFLLSIVGDKGVWLITTKGEIDNKGFAYGETNLKTITASSLSPSAKSMALLFSDIKVV
jgi:hypothetical protein